MPRKMDVEAYGSALADWAHLNPLRRFRRVNDLNLRKLGLMLSVAEGTLRSWEIGSMRPNDTNMESITRVTGITASAWEQWVAGMPKAEAFAREGKA